ncbi:GGDEF domain-containing protein [Paractinoplanes toevensis]|uniref:GGDEF domain-containing protein n=1 Tax=Paractinoplanes toevensis TaxID=571911 RepID=A0A919T806_9ACTN|nr:GGDEF domain-containing protein [Actinoplanes toevensis]GIM90117.1 hypothetical protein Ato02nite_019100 [Actinoplanes toevensis]
MFQTWQHLILVCLSAALLAVLGVNIRLHVQLRRSRYQATHDSTTGLANRHAVTTYLRKALRQGRSIGLVLIDLDRFKAINDIYGHEHGNDVLAEIANRLDTLTRPVLFAARLSGDEFALVVDGGTEHSAAAAHAALRVITRAPVRTSNRAITVTASVGHATAGLGTSVRDLLHTADLAMYQAKRRGRATVHGATTEALGVGGGPRSRDLPRDTTEPAQRPIGRVYRTRD